VVETVAINSPVYLTELYTSISVESRIRQRVLRETKSEGKLQ
jgi:hypothetical protein